jgi:5'-3' exonuclease
MNNPKTFIFIDGSYYCFYKYYSIMNWWKLAHPEEKIDDPINNPIFVEKYKKTFVETVQQIPKKLNLHKLENPPTIIVGKDCKRKDIWRNELYNKYKATRDNSPESGFMGGPFFKMAYEEELFQKAGAQQILHHPRLEADDCIALSVKQTLNEYPNCNIYIITSDNDYLQLIKENIHIYTLAFKNLKKTDVRLKIIMGDVSDNIPSVFPKCGIKTATKCVEDPEFFKKKMANNPDYYKQYELNETLISFDKIPQNLAKEYYETNKINSSKA